MIRTQRAIITHTHNNSVVGWSNEWRITVKTSPNVLPRELSIIADLCAVIDNAEYYFEESNEVCCSPYGCNCYENHKFDMAQAHAELTKMGLKYDGNDVHDMTGENS